MRSYRPMDRTEENKIECDYLEGRIDYKEALNRYKLLTCSDDYLFNKIDKVENDFRLCCKENCCIGTFRRFEMASLLRIITKGSKINKNNCSIDTFRLLTGCKCYAFYSIEGMNKVASRVLKKDVYNAFIENQESLHHSNEKGYSLIVVDKCMFVLFYPVDNIGYLRIRCQNCADDIMSVVNSVSCYDSDEMIDKAWCMSMCVDMLDVLRRTGYETATGPITASMIQMECRDALDSLKEADFDK